MKKTRITLCLLLLAAIAVQAQEALTRVGSLNIVKEVKPPILSIVEGSVKFTDSNGNNAIDANETCRVAFTVLNTGMGEAVGCVAKMTMKGSTDGLSVSQEHLPVIPVGTSVDVSLPVSADIRTMDGQVALTVYVTEPMGFDAVPFDLSVRTRAFATPLVKVADYALSGSTVIVRNTPFDLQVAVQNVKSGQAEDVEVDMVLPNGVYLLSGNEKTHYQILPGRKSQTIAYKMIVPTNYASGTVPVQVKIREKYGKYAESKTIDLPLDRQMTSHSISISETPVEDDRQEIMVATVGSDVDKDIPQTQTENKNTYVLIFANEKYKKAASVPFGLRDGEVFMQYCRQTLGITNNHIRVCNNALLTDMIDGMDWLVTALSFNDNNRAIVYYTGHGFPDEATRDSYLLPVDGNPSNLSTAYRLNEFYRQLGETGKPVTVFLDACFSGAQRDGGMVVAAKSVTLRPKKGAPQGRTVVFSAAQGDETAGFYREQQHGMFTYWLLKELQASQGDVDYKTLSDNLYRNVRQSSFDENKKIQTPDVQNGSDAQNWQSWKLK